MHCELTNTFFFSSDNDIYMQQKGGNHNLRHFFYILCLKTESG